MYYYKLIYQIIYHVMLPLMRINNIMTAAIKRSKFLFIDYLHIIIWCVYLSTKKKPPYFIKKKKC